ncbi:MULTISPECIES: hypothetical protein [unclassified Bradyrhizobium]|uniref:hypothetical protein n=1 Tax=unclassified Bradyrhizobium TaxID=2631580 RepID=UPI001FFC03D5|nr:MULTISPECIES: hypothetical protein [unclassified Bradyrhizobium]
MANGGGTEVLEAQQIGIGHVPDLADSLDALDLERIAKTGRQVNLIKRGFV